MYSFAYICQANLIRQNVIMTKFNYRLGLPFAKMSKCGNIDQMINMHLLIFAMKLAEHCTQNPCITGAMHRLLQCFPPSSGPNAGMDYRARRRRMNHWHNLHSFSAAVADGTCFSHVVIPHLDDTRRQSHTQPCYHMSTSF